MLGMPLGEAQRERFVSEGRRTRLLNFSAGGRAVRLPTGFSLFEIGVRFNQTCVDPALDRGSRAMLAVLANKSASMSGGQ